MLIKRTSFYGVSTPRQIDKTSDVPVEIITVFCFCRNH
jgi:hypothetical protein